MSITVNWMDSSSTGLKAAAYYLLKCVNAGEACSSPAVATGQIVDPGVQAGTVPGLQPAATYTCYVLAINAFAPRGICSIGVAVATAGQGS